MKRGDPLVVVLAKMEMNGVKVDVDLLKDFSKELESQLQQKMGRIHLLAGEEFNINSPQQLARILFEKLKLPVVKKTKTGYSTDVDVLTRLSLQHELPQEVLGYRNLTKLKSTYVDSLPKLVHPETGRVHTSYNQTVTATGRLSSSDPNLQNIPVRAEEGSRIRQAFISEKGRKIASADYSQIELRILAHLSQDESLVEAFLKDEDVHARTASEIFGVSLDQVTPPMRREAKVINFGIIYGMSAYGLSQQLGVDPRSPRPTSTNTSENIRGFSVISRKAWRKQDRRVCHDASPAAPLFAGHPFPRHLHPAGGRENGGEHPSPRNGSGHHQGGHDSHPEAYRGRPVFHPDDHAGS